MKQHISYSNENGTISLLFSPNQDCESLRAFQLAAVVYESITVESDKLKYNTEDAYVDVAKHLWSKLSDIPTDDDGVDGSIDEDFLHFLKGEPVYDIYTWFECEFDLSIGNDLMP